MSAPPTGLRSLRGQPPTPELSRDLMRIGALSADAIAAFWDVLGPTLGETFSSEAERLLDVYCTAFKVSEDDVGRAVRAARFVVREAAGANATRAELAADLAELCPGAPIVHSVLLSGYDAARVRIRNELARAALVEHGSLLTAVKWRADVVKATEGGEDLGVPVTLLTLHYREGDEQRRVTLQVLPDLLEELARACAAGRAPDGQP
ncbi:MAG: hypothetical protein U0271_17350 [Polyangiaceae bacterium]